MEGLGEWLVDAVTLSDNFWEAVRKDFKDNIQKGADKHRDTGTMSRNVYAKKIPNGVEGGIKPQGVMVVWNGKKIPYPLFILHGTRDHDIPLKKKKALRWVGANGRFAFSKGHRVKGIKKDPFLQKAAMETFNDLEKIYQRTK